MNAPRHRGWNELKKQYEDLTLLKKKKQGCKLDLQQIKACYFYRWHWEWKWRFVSWEMHIDPLRNRGDWMISSLRLLHSAHISCYFNVKPSSISFQDPLPPNIQDRTWFVQHARKLVGIYKELDTTIFFFIWANISIKLRKIHKHNLQTLVFEPHKPGLTSLCVCLGGIEFTTISGRNKSPWSWAITA